MSIRFRLLKEAAREHVTYDLGPLRGVLAAGLYGAASLVHDIYDKTVGYELMSRLHRLSWSPRVNRQIAERIREATRIEKNGHPTGLWAFYDKTLTRSVQSFSAAMATRPRRLLGTRILVLKSAHDRERGVLLADYSYVFPLLAGLFDIRAIAEKYFIVLEPSWSGLCTPDLLLYSTLTDPIFVQAGEPVDRQFIEDLQTNLVPVPLAGNWWVDYRPLSPLPRDQRDIDIIMVAAWVTFKRHWRFFRALHDLRKRGRRFRVVLVGYQSDKSKRDIEEEARYFGVSDQIQFFERISPQEVAQLLARSRLHILWSRKEGTNRAIIEAMFADVPVIMHEGFNFGYRYPYINDATGRFANEDTLADTIIEVLDDQHGFSPREWVMQHMTCQRATSILQQQIQVKAGEAGEVWSEDLVVKTTSLNCQEYWDPSDRHRFERDYAFLESTALAR